MLKPARHIPGLLRTRGILRDMTRSGEASPRRARDTTNRLRIAI